MFVTRKNTVRILTPLTLAGALLLAGCSATAQPAPAEVVEVVEEAADASSSSSADSSSTSGGASASTMAAIDIDTGDEGLDAALETLSTELNAAAGTGVVGVGIHAWNADNVTVNVVVEYEDGADVATVTPAQLKPILTVLQAFDAPAPVGTYEVRGYGSDDELAYIAASAEELGVVEELIDHLWDMLMVPGDAVNAIL